MKKLLFFTAFVLFARENPFVLPSASTPKAVSSAVSSVTAVKQMYTSASVPTKIESQTVKSDATWRPVKKLQNATSPADMKKVADFGFLQLYIKDNTLRFVTQDRLRHTFTVDKPKKAVFDFAARRRFASKTVEVKKRPFDRISIGAHKNFYRVAVEVEKSCKPQFNGLELICR